MNRQTIRNRAKIFLCALLASAAVTAAPMQLECSAVRVQPQNQTSAFSENTQQQKLYAQIAKAVMQGKTTLDITLDTPVQSEQEMIALCRDALHRVRRDYPESFLDNHTDFAYYGDRRGYSRVVYTFGYLPLTAAQKQSLKDEVAEIVEEGKKQTKTTPELLCYFQQVLKERVDYDTKAAQGTSDADPTAFHAYGALMEGQAVCQGYAYAFKMLCDQAQIPCWIVTGYYKEPHAWNYVLLNGNYYQVDITWDDAQDRPARSQTFLAGKKYAQQYTIEDNSAPGTLAEQSYFEKQIPAAKKQEEWVVNKTLSVAFAAGE